MYEEQKSPNPGVSAPIRGGCPFKPGLERHLVPSGNPERIVTKETSDYIFGSDGLGFADGVWSKIISWLARNGIQEQTGSKPDETDIEGCVKGWGQGPYSSRVFNVETGVDTRQMERLIAHLNGLAVHLKITNGRITDRVLAAFVESQAPELYSTWTGLRSPDSLRSRLGARFRAHIQWQAFVELCGVVDEQGVKHVTPCLIREFFQSEEPFFERLKRRRAQLRNGTIKAGEQLDLPAKIEPWVDRKASDIELSRDKDGGHLVWKIAKFMWVREGSSLPPLTTEIAGTPTHQYTMTVVVPVLEPDVPQLRTQLASFNQEIVGRMRGGNTVCSLPLHEVETLHYGRFVLIDASPVHDDPALLVFSTNFDGPSGAPMRDEAMARQSHLNELVEKAYAGLDTIYGHCVGYQSGSTASDLIGYLADPAHQIPSQTFYTGASGRSRAQILAEAELRESVEAAADVVARKTPAGTDPEQVREAILVELKSRGVSIPPPFPPQPDGKAHIHRVVLLTLGIILLTLPVSVPVIVVLYLILRYKEATDVPEAPQHNEASVRHVELASVGENEFLQNQLTHLVDLKDGWFRLLAIKGVFVVLQFLVTYRYNKGRLGNIPSIHFAHWGFLGKKRRVLFFSNFDNSWQSYLGDFIDQASNGLTGIWSNTKGYPKTENLIYAGARNATSFLAWTRAHQLPTDLWFSAYPAQSIRGVNANTMIRRGLTDLKGVPARDWLRTLGGEDVAPLEAPDAVDPKPNPVTLPLDDIQGIILKGYGFLEHAAFLMLKVEAPEKARRWLSQLPLTPVSNGSKDDHHHKSASEKPTFVNVAFSHAGLAALGADSTLLGGFPPEFVMGSHEPYRSRVLGDVGKNAPENWRWGNADFPVHVLLMVYCYTKEKLQEARHKYITEAKANGLSIVVDHLDGYQLPGRKEHFGFRDGISQPRLRDFPSDESNEATDLAPGEFLLGFPNGYHAHSDTGDTNVTFAPKTADGFEFCKGGSYLVFRQLEQDVPAFWRYCKQASAQAGLSPVALASKMVGRWPNGEPLVLSPDGMRHPKEPSDEDTFGYISGEPSDIQGERCPFGAHVRRTNPRDWLLGNNTTESVRLSMLHRIIRRGRPYGPPLRIHPASEHEIDDLIDHPGTGDGAQRGLQFLCFNANIERQFEFIQQQWANNPQLGALHADADPLIGGQNLSNRGIGASPSVFTLQADPIRHRCPGMSDFVQVKGSTYFFMPPISAVRHLKQESAAWGIIKKC